MLFSGHENAISLTREYYHDYACDFELSFYPFDTQVSIFSRTLFFFIFGKALGSNDDYYNFDHVVLFLNFWAIKLKL